MSLDYVAKLIDRRENITNKTKRTLDFRLIGNRLDTIRKENNLKQKEMAEIIGVSQPTYFNYKNGNTPIQTEILKTIANNFNISLDWLVGKSNKKYLN